MITQDDIDAMCGDELLPCPFCGGEASQMSTFKGVKVECSNRSRSCPVNMRTRYKSTLVDAYTAWNTRANLQTPPDKV